MSGTHNWSVDILPTTYFSWSPSTLTFSDLLIDYANPQHSTSQTVTITNLSTVTITLTASFWNQSGMQDAFTMASSASGPWVKTLTNFTIAGSGTKTIWVRFDSPTQYGSNNNNFRMVCSSPTGCANQTPGGISLSGNATRCIAKLDSYLDWTDPVIENTQNQTCITLIHLKNQYGSGSPDYGGAGQLYWKLFSSTDGVTYTEYASCEMDGTTYTPCYGFTGVVQPGQFYNPPNGIEFAANVPAYNVNPAHKWYLGLKVWGQSEGEPANLSFIFGQSNTVVIGGLIVIGLIGGLLWYTKKKKMW